MFSDSQEEGQGRPSEITLITTYLLLFKPTLCLDKLALYAMSYDHLSSVCDNGEGGVNVVAIFLDSHFEKVLSLDIGEIPGRREVRIILLKLVRNLSR